MTAICSIGTSTPRSPRATMMPSAALAGFRRDASSASERSILAMMKGRLPMRGAAARTASMSAAVSTNDWLTASTPFSSANSRQARSWSVNALMPRSMPGRLRPFSGSQLAADGDFALHVVARHALDDQLHQAVVEEEPVARLHHARQPLEAHRDPVRVADDVLAGQRESCARHAAGSAPARSCRRASWVRADRP